MAIWRVADAKARLSEMLDKTETEEPQVIRRRKTEFHLLTKEQLVERCKPQAEGKASVSAWDALRPPDDLCFDYEFPRAKGKARAAKF